jgi:hypothetical protein
MKRILAAALVLFATSTAFAQVGETSYNWPIGAPIGIPDNNATGISVDLVVNDNIPLSLEPTNCVEVTLTFGRPVGAGGHTWAGDLIARLTKVGDGSSFLFNRIGRTSGSTGFGDSSDMVGPYTITNKTNADIWAAAFTAGSTAAIPSGSYRATNTSAVTTSAPPIDLCAPFLAAGSVGTWRLTISDNAGGDTGTLVSASLNLKPEPATMALLGLGALALIRRRRAA